MLATRNDSLKDKVCLVSGAGNVAQYTTEKIHQLGGKVVSLSDSTGYLYDEEGIDESHLQWVMYLENVKRARIKEYVEKYPKAQYTAFDGNLDHNPLWNHKADCRFSSATQNEINAKDAHNLVNNGVYLVCEGANMPSTPDAMMDQGIV